MNLKASADFKTQIMIMSYLSSRFRSLGHAFRGIRTLVTTQPNARLHLLATSSVIAAGFFMHLRRWEWIALLLCIGMVWMAESLNTALEFLANEVSTEKRELLGKAKDVAAGGVLITALVSIVVAMMILRNHLR